MASALLRALTSTLLVGAVLFECVASDRGETTSAPESIITIPKDGIYADEQKIVWLGPSAALRIVDSTNAAVFKPQANGESSTAPSSESMNRVAYVFENDACDFTKTVEYKQLFSGYQGPFWVRSPQATVTDGDGSSPLLANYTFTSPAVDVVGGVASFCIRFMFKSPGSTNAEPPGQGSGAPGVPPDHGDESEGGTGGGKEDDSELHPSSPELQADPTQQPPPSIQDSQSSVGSTNRDGSNGAGSRAGGRGSSGSTDQEVPKKEEEDSGPVSQESSHENDVLKPLPASEPNPVPLPGVAKPERGLDNGHAGEHTAAENTNSKLPTAEGSNLESPQGAGGLGESQEAEEAKGLAQSPDGSLLGAPHARLRRLSEPKETPAHYLTVIVHFDGRSVSRGMAALSSVFFVGATVLLSAF